MSGLRPELLTLAVAAIAAWLLIGALGLARPRHLGFVSRVLFPLGAAVGLALAVVGFVGIASPPQTLVLPLGLPDLPFHLRLDALSAFFLLLLGAASAGDLDLLRRLLPLQRGHRPRRHLRRSTTCSSPSMALVLLADDAYAFMVAWESMALSSYFLVTTEHRIPEIRRAGFLYLLIAHVGAIGILLCFGVLQGGSGDYTFDAMRSAKLAGALADGGVLPRAVRLRRQGRDRCRCTSGCRRRTRRRRRRCRR